MANSIDVLSIVPLMLIDLISEAVLIVALCNILPFNAGLEEFNLIELTFW